jgi:molybdopterin converting factor small subunit
MKLRFTGPLLRLVDYERAIDLSAANLGQALDQIEQRHPRLRPVLKDGEGRLRRAHRVFVNGDLVSVDLNTPLNDSDDIEFLTAIAGG